MSWMISPNDTILLLYPLWSVIFKVVYLVPSHYKYNFNLSTNSSPPLPPPPIRKFSTHLAPPPPPPPPASFPQKPCTGSVNNVQTHLPSGVVIIVISKHKLQIKFMSNYCDVDLRWKSQNPIADISIMVHIMVWYHQATSQYLGQCWPRSMLPHYVASLGHSEPMSLYWWVIEHKTRPSLPQVEVYHLWVCCSWRLEATFDLCTFIHPLRHLNVANTDQGSNFGLWISPFSKCLTFSYHVCKIMIRIVVELSVNQGSGAVPKSYYRCWHRSNTGLIE